MIHYAWVIAFTGTLVTILAHGFGRMSYSVILPSMREGLGLSYTEVGLIGTGNFIGYLVLSICGGFLAVRFGVRRVVFLSLLVIGVSLFLTGLSRSFLFAFLMRLVTGAGNGGSYVPMMALPAAWFAVRRRGLASGIVSGGIGIGLFLSGIVLPPILAKSGEDGWRYAWFLLGGTVFALSFVCLAFIRDRPAEMGLIPYGGEPEAKAGGRSTLFGDWRSVVKEREIWKLSLVYFMFGFSHVIYLTFFVAYLCQEGGLQPAEAGGIFSVLGIFGIFCGVVWGGLSDILGRRNGALLAYLALAFSYLVFAFWKAPAGYLLSAIVFGLTAWSIPTIMAAAAGDAMGGRLAPAGLGFITLIFGIGLALGPVAGGYIKDATGTFTFAFIFSAAVSLIGSAGSLILKKKETGIRASEVVN